VYRTAVVLPIELTKFTGSQQNDKIGLNWVTASETNVHYFEVEHSTDGNHFEKTGTVASKFHNSTAATAYELMHASPVKGINFYRLRQFDLDGKFKYSVIIPVQFNYSIVQSIKINPNPVINNLNIALTLLENSNILCKIYNIDGREVKSLTADALAGKNNIVSDVSGLAKGNYIVVIISKNERVAETKFIKQ